MEVYEQTAYKELEEVVLKHFEHKSNLMVISLPGLGVSYLLKSLIRKNTQIKSSYVTDGNAVLEALNIIDIDSQRDLTTADRYFQKADIDQKFVLVVNRPELLKVESYALSHTYESYYFKARGKGDNDQFVLEINPKLSQEQLKRIYELGGGIAKISKYLAVHPEKTAMTAEQLTEEEELKRLAADMVMSAAEANGELLEKTGLKRNGEWVAEILQKWQWGEAKTDILVNFDLSFRENGETAKERLTKEEKEILEYMLGHEGQIDREKVSDIKWGEGKYDEFSDQAINKTMRRLNDKLNKYEIETIPKVGYKIKNR